MAKKNIPDKNGFVFSTDPAFQFSAESAANSETLPPAKQRFVSFWTAVTGVGKQLRRYLDLQESRKIWKLWVKRLNNIAEPAGL